MSESHEGDLAAGSAKRHLSNYEDAQGALLAAVDDAKERGILLKLSVLLDLLSSPIHYQSVRIGDRGTGPAHRIWADQIHYASLQAARIEIELASLRKKAAWSHQPENNLPDPTAKSSWFGERVRVAIDFGGGKERVSAGLGIPGYSLSGEMLSGCIIVRLADFCGVRVEWLVAGRGPMVEPIKYAPVKQTDADRHQLGGLLHYLATDRGNLRHWIVEHLVECRTWAQFGQFIELPPTTYGTPANPVASPENQGEPE